MTDPVVRTVPALDEVAGEEGAVVLLGAEDDARILRISPLAHAVRELAADGMPLSSLTVELTARFDEPPEGDAAALVRSMVEELRDQGLVELSG